MAGRSIQSLAGMGPEVVIIALGYNVAALMTVVHGLGMCIRATRMWSASIVVVAGAVGAWGYFTAPPYWELHGAAYLFAAASVILTVGSVAFVGLRWLYRRIREEEAKGHAV